MNFNPEATQHAIRQHTKGDSLNPMSMLYDGQIECFNLIGEVKKSVSEIQSKDSSQETKIEHLQNQIGTLQARLWQIISGVILAVVGGAVTWFVT